MRDKDLIARARLTYFDPSLQQEVLKRIDDWLLPGGALVVGVHESLPDAGRALEP